MSLNIASCDDEPPEPPDQNICCVMDLQITLIDGGICFTFRSSSVLFAFRVHNSWRQITWTKCRVQCPVVDQRHEMSTMQRTATFWNYSTLRSSRHQVYSLRLTRSPLAFGTLAFRNISTPARRYLPDVPSRRPVENKESLSPTPPKDEGFRIPTIVITPPPPTEYDPLNINAVPTPQDASFGHLLTLPDPELEVINRRGLGMCRRPELPKVFERRRQVTKLISRSEAINVPLDDRDRGLGSRPHCGRGIVPVDEDEDEIDVRSWCG